MRVPFRFKMQKVLDYREQLEEEAKVNLAIQRSRLAEAQDRLDRIKAELRQAEDRLVGAVLMDAAERWLLEQYVKGLRADAAHEAIQVRMLEQLAEEARKLLAERAIDKKLLEKLKERQKQHYAREEQLKEQRTNDETATLRYKAPTL